MNLIKRIVSRVIVIVVASALVGLLSTCVHAGELWITNGVSGGASVTVTLLDETGNDVMDELTLNALTSNHMPFDPGWQVIANGLDFFDAALLEDSLPSGVEDLYLSFYKESPEADPLYSFDTAGFYAPSIPEPQPVAMFMTGFGVALGWFGFAWMKRIAKNLTGSGQEV